MQSKYFFPNFKNAAFLKFLPIRTIPISSFVVFFSWCWVVSQFLHFLGIFLDFFSIIFSSICCIEMDVLSENRLVEQIAEVGIRLLQPPTCTPELLDLLDEVEFLLTKVGQAPSQLVQKALLIPMKALIADELFKHSDPNVRITIASCLNEVTRITAPIPPFEDGQMREIFELIVSSFENLLCQPGRCYSKAVLILESVARLRSCVMMLDLDCDPLVTKMFELFLRNISPKHPQAVLLAMVNIMTIMIQESDYVSLELLKVLLASVRMENRSVSPASWELSAKILEGCKDKLRPFIVRTISLMGCCLEDYMPILSSICKPEPNIVADVINDSSFPINNEPSSNLSHSADYVQALEATERFECIDALRTGATASKRVEKQNSQNLDEEATDPHEMNDEPFDNPSLPVEYVQALEAAESCQIAPAEYVQALEAAEIFDCVNSLETGGTSSKRLDDEATNLHQVNDEPPGNPSHPPEFVQALVAAETFESVDALGTASRRGRKSDSQNLNEEATGIEREQDDISKNNGALRKDVAFERVREEADGFENKQAFHSSLLGDNRKKRGRPRKKDVTGVFEDKALKNKNDVSVAPGSSGKKLLKQDEFSGGSGNKAVLAEYVQALEAAESFECVNALGTERTAFKRGWKSDSQNLDEKSIGLKHEQDHQGTADDDISKNDGILRKDVALKRVKEEADDFENKQAYHSSALGDKRRRRGRPRKNDMRVSRDKALEKKNDVSVAQGSSGDSRRKGRPPKKQQEFSGGFGHKAELAEYVQALEVEESFECVNALGTGGTASKRGSNSDSQNLDEEATSLEFELDHQGIAEDDISNNNGILREDVAFKRVEEEAACHSSASGDSRRKRGRPPKKDVTRVSGGSGNKGTADDDILKKDVAFKRVKEEADGFEYKQAYHSSALGDSRRKRGRPPKKDVSRVSGGSGNKGTADDDILKKDVAFMRVKEEADGFEYKQAYHSYAVGDSRRKRGRPPKKDVTRVSGGSGNKVIETPDGRKNYEDDLVGCRIKVWWPLDRRFYEGRITMFDASMRRHKVNYEDGDEEMLNLKKERWEFVAKENFN